MRHGRLAVGTGLVLLAVAPAAGRAASATLSWTAPGDDGLSGRATKYDLRYSNQPITAFSFALAMPVTGLPSPAPSGTRESWIVNGLAYGVTYYFALRTVDDQGNWSPLSNLGVKGGPLSVPEGTREDGLSAPWPNPARSVTRFVLNRAAAGDVDVAVFDAQGRRLKNLVQGRWPGGEVPVVWDLLDEHGIPVPAGLYQVRARVADQTYQRRVAILR